MSDPARNLNESERQAHNEREAWGMMNRQPVQYAQRDLNNAYRDMLEAMPIAQFPPKPRPSFWRGFMDGLALGPLRRLVMRWIGR